MRLLGPMVLESDFMAIRTGNMSADSRHGTKAVAESLNLDPQAEGR